jgi:23S rRNA pseudouridine2605 synthase
MKPTSSKPSPENSAGIRINQFLSRSGVASRRQADTLIVEGKVRVNGVVKKEPGFKINPQTDKVEYQHTNTAWHSVEQVGEMLTIALYKPKGYVTSMARQGKDPIISELLPKSPRVYPVGRLDKDSEGLILCTNDGDFAAALTHPRTHIEKEYIVHVIIPKNFTENNLKGKLGRLAKGVRIDGRKTLPCTVEFLRFLRPQMVEIRIVLQEGRNRQIRRMLGSIDCEVFKLIRTRIGELSLESLNLKHGEYKEVSHNNVL